MRLTYSITGAGDWTRHYVSECGRFHFRQYAVRHGGGDLIDRGREHRRYAVGSLAEAEALADRLAMRPMLNDPNGWLTRR